MSIASGCHRIFCVPALQYILEKCVRELGAIRLIDLLEGVPGKIATKLKANADRFGKIFWFATRYGLLEHSYLVVSNAFDQDAQLPSSGSKAQ